MESEAMAIATDGEWAAGHADYVRRVDASQVAVAESRELLKHVQQLLDRSAEKLAQRPQQLRRHAAVEQALINQEIRDGG